MLCLAHLQAALAAASALFQQSGTYEDQETCTKAWSQVAEQLETLFAVQVEDIQSKQTQEIQQYENLLSEARTRSLLVFYGGGFINRLMDCSTRDQVLELMQVSTTLYQQHFVAVRYLCYTIMIMRNVLHAAV